MRSVTWRGDVSFIFLFSIGLSLLERVKSGAVFPRHCYVGLVVPPVFFFVFRFLHVLAFMLFLQPMHLLSRGGIRSRPQVASHSAALQNFSKTGQH